MNDRDAKRERDRDREQRLRAPKRPVPRPRLNPKKPPVRRREYIVPERARPETRERRAERGAGEPKPADERGVRAHIEQPLFARPGDRHDREQRRVGEQKSVERGSPNRRRKAVGFS